MARIKFDTKQIGKNLIKRFDEFKSSKKEMDKVGRIVTREIKVNSRKGIGYDGRAFPSITSKTIDRRKKLSTVNRTNRDFSAGKSNATFMGDTINKITYQVKRATVIIFGKGNHRIIKGLRGKTLQGSNAKISEIITGLQGKGWRIMGVSKKARAQIRTNFIRFLRRRRK